MRKLIIAAALATSALSLGGCATIHNIDQAVALANQPVGDLTVADEKAWYTAEALYNVPAQIYLSVNSRGFFAGHEALKATIKAELQQLNRLRGDVYQAHKALDAATFHEKIVQMKALSDMIRTQLPTTTSQIGPLPAASPDVLARRVALS